jgi:hypothetical protein
MVRARSRVVLRARIGAILAFCGGCLTTLVVRTVYDRWYRVAAARIYSATAVVIIVIRHPCQREVERLAARESNLLVNGGVATLGGAHSERTRREVSERIFATGVGSCRTPAVWTVAHFEAYLTKRRGALLDSPYQRKLRRRRQARDICGDPEGQQRVLPEIVNP